MIILKKNIYVLSIYKLLLRKSSLEKTTVKTSFFVHP